jgi:hypothetical protein
MALYDDLIAALPELEGSDAFAKNLIVLQNDGDAIGDYIAAWHFVKPLPKGFKVGK